MPGYDTWRILNATPTPAALAQYASVCSISNGYLGLNGSVAEFHHDDDPVTLLAGVNDELDMFSLIRPAGTPRPYLDPRYFDTAGPSPSLANLPDPLFVRLFVGEREVSLSRGGVSNFEQSLDLATGVHRYSFDYRDGWNRATHIEMQRFAALRHPHRVFMRYAVTPLDHESPLQLLSGINGAIRANPTRARQFAVTELWAEPAERCRLTVLTTARNHTIRLGVVNHLQTKGASAPPRGYCEHDAVYTRYSLDPARHGETITLTRFVVLTSSEDLRHRVVADLDAELDAAVALGYDAALEEQRAAWQALWDRSDVQLDGDDPAQLGLRFCLHHLLAAAPRFSDRLSVPVKLLTSEYYQGSVFYDTDLYILPFYTLTQPELARTCLNFRCEGLRPAREAARNLGYDGAKFPWQAGPYGEECLGQWWRFTCTNIHINADIAYALMHYVWATGDERLLDERGIDLLVETARFYAARAVHDEAHDRFDLLDVTGPDEGHCGGDNNFYTNYLAGRNLRWAADAVTRLAHDDPRAYAVVANRLALKADEPARWRHIAEHLTLLFDPQTGLYEQHAGFHQLKPIPGDLLDERRTWFVPIAQYQALNQPDVLAAFMLFRDDFPDDVRRANWEYYRTRSLNFSSISFAANAILAADVGDLPEAYKHFVYTCGQDLDEALTGRKDTYAGLHGTSAGGAWLAAVCGFGGVCLSERGLRIRPNLPPQWTALRFNLVLRGVTVNVAIDRRTIVLTVGRERRAAMPVTVGNEALTLRSGETHTVQYGG